MEGKQINFNKFSNFLNEHLGDRTSYASVNKLFDNICDKKNVKIFFI